MAVRTANILAARGLFSSYLRIQVLANPDLSCLRCYQNGIRPRKLETVCEGGANSI
jgi:hypothetical protein